MNHSVLNYFIQAGFVVKTVLCILLSASVASWTLIFQRHWFFKTQRKLLVQFKNIFWSSKDLTKLYTDVHTTPHQERHGLFAIFYAGFKEYTRATQHSLTGLATIQRVMQIACAKESVQLEEHLHFFASVGSISPYIGLFGTVWGIMTSFQSLGQAQQATIAMVAPGISEALVATALGLFTAIPAVIMYNRYSTYANELLEQYDLFQEEFLALIEQQTTSTQKG